MVSESFPTCFICSSSFTLNCLLISASFKFRISRMAGSMPSVTSKNSMLRVSLNFSTPYTPASLRFVSSLRYCFLSVLERSSAFSNFFLNSTTCFFNSAISLSCFSFNAMSCVLSIASNLVNYMRVLFARGNLGSRACAVNRSKIDSIYPLMIF